MATATEIWRSRRVTEDEDSVTAEHLYHVKGTDDELVAKAALKAQAPTSYNGAPRKECGITERVAETIWLGMVSYEGRRSNPADYELTFDTTGATAHITNSLETVGRHAPPGEMAPWFQTALNVQDERVEGTDIVVPKYDWTESFVLDATLITETYRKFLASVTGMVNSIAFRTFAPGEVLFFGASGTKRWEDLQCRITFRYIGISTVRNLVIGQIIVPHKEGHHFLWVRNQPGVDGNHWVKRPVAAYVERVYEATNFNTILPTVPE